MRLTGIWHTSRGISDKALNADQGSEWESVITAASLWKSKKLTLASKCAGSWIMKEPAHFLIS